MKAYGYGKQLLLEPYCYRKQLLLEPYGYREQLLLKPYGYHKQLLLEPYGYRKQLLLEPHGYHKQLLLGPFGYRKQLLQYLLKLSIFLSWVGVIKPHYKFALEIFLIVLIQQGGLGMTNMKISEMEIKKWASSWDYGNFRPS